MQRQLGSGYRSVKIVVKKAAGEAQKLLKVPQVKPSEIPGVKPPESTKKVLSMDVLEKVAGGADGVSKSSARLAAEREAFEKMLSDAEKEVAERAAQQEPITIDVNGRGHGGKDGRYLSKAETEAARESGNVRVDKSGGAVAKDKSLDC